MLVKKSLKVSEICARSVMVFPSDINLKFDSESLALQVLWYWYLMLVAWKCLFGGCYLILVAEMVSFSRI